MNRMVLIFVIVVGILLAFDAAVYGLLGLAMLLVLIATAFSYLLRGKPLNDFWLLLAELIFGPCIVLCLVKLLLGRLGSVFSSQLSSIAVLIIIVVLMVVSFLYVRARLAAQKNHKEQLHTNERQPMLPVREDQESEFVDHARH